MSYRLGLGGAYHHDASACLVSDEGGIIAFVEEERFTRVKHAKNSRSCTRSAAYCLAVAGIRLQDVDEIAVAWNPKWPSPTDCITDKKLICELLDPASFAGYSPERLTVIEHHLAHAAAAFYPSGFSDSAVLVVDGSGDGVSTSLYHGNSTGLKLLKQYPFTQSLGWFYETVAEHIGLGDWTSAGKLMGLSGYGKPVYDLDFLSTNSSEGYFIDLSRYGLCPTDEDKADYSNFRYYGRLKSAYRSAFTALGVPPYRRSSRYSASNGSMIADAEFAAKHANLAASAQLAIERSLLNLARSAMTLSGSRQLCVSGGVGLNCSSNGVLHRSSGSETMFVQPAAGDAGCAIGAALECAHRTGAMRIPGRAMESTAWGPAFTDDQIAETLSACNIRNTYYGKEIVAPASAALAAGRTIGWFQGGAEGGPRALGNRSILADPRTTSMRDRINRDIKHREMWRPLAPSILATAANRFILNPGSSEFMIVAHKATEEAFVDIPAAVHVDASLRPQTVRDSVNPLFANLLRAFDLETGVPALINTSFNHEAEPMVCTPTDALRTFFSTPLDVLAIGGFLIQKDF